MADEPVATAAPCKVCAAREKAIAEGRWTGGFRFCPHCGAGWRITRV